jgi:hypothetical protein
MKMLIAGVLAVWFASICLLGANGAFVGPPQSPPIPILVGAMTPLIAFFAAYFAWGEFRRTVLTADLRLLTMVQAWRAAGLGFLALSANGILPARFALPAGWGDIAIGVTAPIVALALMRHPGFGRSRLFVMWNFLGVLDLVVAVSMGTLSSGFLPGRASEITTAAMGRLPLVVIPVFLVPVFAMLHFVAIRQALRGARSGWQHDSGRARGDLEHPFGFCEVGWELKG